MTLDTRLTPPFPRPKVKCLLVDDLAENLHALSALLAADDVELLLARSGTEALEILLVHDVALALVDVQMPEMDGFQLAETMRGVQRTRDVPIIFVTAGSHDRHRQFQGYDSGAVDFLFKPIEPHILKSKAGVFFQLWRQKQQLAWELQERTESLRMQEMFTAVLSHDLRGPLTAIQLSAKILEKRADEDAQKLGGRIARSARWMAHMIEDLLDLTRVRLGQGLPITRAPTDLAAVLKTVIQERQVLHPEGRIEFTHEGQLDGSWDADRLVQVASNLIGNALRHGTPGGTVKVRADGRHADRVVLSVSNDGNIPPELLPSIFDPFRRGQREGERTEGLGLGLYIVQQVVQAHGGAIQVQSEEGEPTRFDVSLPRHGSARGATTEA
ncbi:MAG: hybrid sensor histidine kinase/response regulator [Rhizobacter sp.]|nr:hybrid sensor histidine kinase/response regulator [Rhizobacter sp.]